MSRCTRTRTASRVDSQLSDPTGRVLGGSRRGMPRDRIRSAFPGGVLTRRSRGPPAVLGGLLAWTTYHIVSRRNDGLIFVMHVFARGLDVRSLPGILPAFVICVVSGMPVAWLFGILVPVPRQTRRPCDRPTRCTMSSPTGRLGRPTEHACPTLNAGVYAMNPATVPLDTLHARSLNDPEGFWGRRPRRSTGSSLGPGPRRFACPFLSMVSGRGAQHVPERGRPARGGGSGRPDGDHP